MTSLNRYLKIKPKPPVQPLVTMFLQAAKQNLPLKMVALSASIILYFYVQQERNPILQRPLIALIQRVNKPADVDIDPDNPPRMVTVTGPKPIVERLKDSDITAIADLSTLQKQETAPQLVRMKYSLPTLTRQMTDQLTFDPPEPMLRVQVYMPVTRVLPVKVNYPKEPLAGFQYGKPELKPSSVKISGRLERVNHVERLVVNAAPASEGAKVDGDFDVLAKDHDDNIVEGVSLTPSTIHVLVPLLEELPTKIVPVSVSIPDLPLPPYQITEITPTPHQVKITGRQDVLAHISTVATEIISAHDFTASQYLTANLLVSPDIAIHDMDDRQISAVKVHIVIKKSPSVVTTPAEPSIKPVSPHP